LYEIVGIATGDEVAGGAQADETGVPPDDLCLACAIAGACTKDKMKILNLTLSLVRLAALGDRCHEMPAPTSFPRQSATLRSPIWRGVRGPGLNLNLSP
jgi:hypothetical protein